MANRSRPTSGRGEAELSFAVAQLEAIRKLRNRACTDSSFPLRNSLNDGGLRAAFVFSRAGAASVRLQSECRFRVRAPRARRFLGAAQMLERLVAAIVHRRMQ